VNELLPAENRVRLSADERLIGPEGQLDSLGYINLVTALEQEFENEFGRSLPLVTDGSSEDPADPLRTVSTLADYLTERLEKGRERDPAAHG
jgi:acyl carrier protein